MKDTRNLKLLFLLVLLLCAFWLFNYGPLQLTEKTVEECGLWAHNMYNYFLPEYDYVFSRLESGRLPLWNPFQACGFPALAGLQGGVFYLPNMLFLLMPAAEAICYSTLFHLCLAGTFMFLLFRRLFPQSHPAGALAASLAFVFNPRMYEFVLFPGNFMTASWLPAVFYFSERVVTKRTFASAGLLAFAVSMTFLAGFTQVTAYIYETAGIFILYLLIKDAIKVKDNQKIYRTFGLLLLTGVTAAFLAGPQLLTSYELVGLSARSIGNLTPQMSQVYGPGANAFLPWLKGVLTYSRAFMLADGVHPIPPWSLFLLLAPLGAFWRKKRATYAFFLLLGLVGFVLSLGTNTPLYSIYWDYFPTGDWFTTPIRLRLVFYFCFSILAGTGVSVLLDDDLKEIWRQKDYLRLLGLLILLSVVIAGTCLAFVRDSLALNLTVLTLHVALISCLLIASRQRNSRLRKYLLNVLIFIIIGESVFWYRNLVPFPMKVNPKKNLYNKAVATALDPPGRAHIENGWGMGFYGSPQVPEKFGSVFEVPVTTNWEPLSLRSYQEFCNYMTGRTWYYGRFQLAGRPFSEKMFDMLSAKYIIFSDAGKDWIHERLQKRPEEGRYRLYKDMGTARIYENLEAFDRVNFAGSWEVITNPNDLLLRLRSDDFDPRTAVLLEEPPKGTGLKKLSGMPDGVQQAIQSFTIEYETARIDVDAPEAGIVWMSDTFYPGWEGWVDGVKSRVLRVNHAFRGVYVEPGRHTITMNFNPGSYRWGLLLGLAGIILLIGEFCWTGISKAVKKNVAEEALIET
jgi:hypothetical protein